MPYFMITPYARLELIKALIRNALDSLDNLDNLDDPTLWSTLASTTNLLASTATYVEVLQARTNLMAVATALKVYRIQPAADCIFSMACAIHMLMYHERGLWGFQQN